MKQLKYFSWALLLAAPHHSLHSMDWLLSKISSPDKSAGARPTPKVPTNVVAAFNGSIYDDLKTAVNTTDIAEFKEIIEGQFRNKRDISDIASFCAQVLETESL